MAEYIANIRRPFWVDELTTYYLADVPSIDRIWRLIQQGIEMNPPLLFWMTWLIHHTLGQGEVLTRLPALVGFWLMCVCLFHFVRRRSDVLHGFMALLLPLFTFTQADATFARGYGLMLGFSAAALLCWQLATDRVHRALALLGLIFSVAGAVSCHYYGLYIAGAIGIGELVRTFDRKRVDWGLWLALLAGVTSLAAYLPLLRTIASGSRTFWISPMARFLYESYADLFGPSAMILLLLLVFGLRIPVDGERCPQWKPLTIPRHEVTACLILVAMPLIVFISAFFLPVAFFTRYVQPVVIGFSSILALFWYRVGGGNLRFRQVTISLLVWLCLVPWTLWHLGSLALPPPAQAVEARLGIALDSSLPVVVDNDNDFMTLFHYTPMEKRVRLFTLVDRRAALRYLGSEAAVRFLSLIQTFRDVHVVDYHEFVSHNREFLLARTRPEGWILQALLAEGARIQLLKQDKAPGHYVEDRLLFHVIVTNSH